MKSLFRIAALALALMLALPALSLAETAQDAAADPVVLTFDGTEYTLSDLSAELDALYNGGYVEDANDYDSAMDSMLMTLVLHDKIKKEGLDQFTEDEEAAFLAEAQQEWDQAIQEYVDYFKTDDSEEALAELAKQAEAYYAAYGYSVDYIAESLKEADAYSRLESLMVGGRDVSVSQAEIDQVFAQWVEEDKELVGDDVFSYELYRYYYGYNVCYIPEGYRSIIHILLTVDDSLLNALSDAQATFEESVTEENPDGDAALLAAVADAKAAIIASRKAALDEIFDRLEKGEAFQTLIAEYGEDPGMEDPVQLETGYPVHRDSIVWDSAFTAAAFSEKMVQPGDVSDPVVGANGIHILYYLRDIPGGASELTDEISQSIENYLGNQKLNQCYSEAISQWTAEHEIVINQEVLDMAKAAAAEEADAE